MTHIRNLGDEPCPGRSEIPGRLDVHKTHVLVPKAFDIEFANTKRILGIKHHNV